MTEAEIIQSVVDHVGLNKREAAEMVDAFFEKISSTVGKLDAQDEGLTERERRATDRGAYSRFQRVVAEAKLTRFIQADYQAECFSYSVDEAAIERAERFDGKLVLLTSIDDFPAAEIVTRYKNLADIERGFRVLKSDLEIAPVYHRLPERIRADALICFLALVLYRVMRMRLKAHGSSASPKTALELLRRIQKHRASIGEHTYTGISKTTQGTTRPLRRPRSPKTRKTPCSVIFACLMLDKSVTYEFSCGTSEAWGEC